MAEAQEPEAKRSRTEVSPPSIFCATTAADARSLTDCTTLQNGVLMPYVGYGTYKLGAGSARAAVAAALRKGYRHIDTAYIYAGEKTETEVGKALASAFTAGTVRRKDVFVTTKHWRKFHGYDAALGCLNRSLQRLQLDYVDCWMIHWPGPAWSTMNRKNEELERNGPWHYAVDGHGQDEIVALRAETWRAMEEALRCGKARSIAVSNFTVAHLEALKATATIWPPSLNQVELHPYYPQTELREYCKKEGIQLEAYASLGGQDGSKAKWEGLGGRLLEAAPVLAAAAAHKHAESGATAGADSASKGAGKGAGSSEAEEGRSVTAAQVLLRWALQHGIIVIPKTASEARMVENAAIYDFSLSDDEMRAIDALAENAPEHSGRTCWRTDPLRLLEFD